MSAATVKRIGLFGGPMLGLVCYYLLPTYYSTGPGEWVEFTQAGRATLGMRPLPRAGARPLGGIGSRASDAGGERGDGAG